MKKDILFFSFLFILTIGAAQVPSVDILTSGTNTSLRGLSVVTDHVIWVSGSKGTIGKSTNGGKTWKWLVVKGFEEKEFRDIEAFNATTAVIMAVGEPAYILKTTDGGDSWKVVYENKTKGMFLDAMEFWNEQAGIIIGDPIGGRFFITRTFDGGSSWQDIPVDKRPIADSGEVCFAASGTNIRALDNDEVVFISGGTRSNLFKRNQKIKLPLNQGKETTGANSVAVWDRFQKKGGKKFIVVGGDFSNPSSDSLNCGISNDGGNSWHYPATPPHGYRSCVEFLSKKDVITCGLSGVDYSDNGGNNWKWISKEGFHVCRIAKSGSSVYLAGNNGKIGKINWD